QGCEWKARPIQAPRSPIMKPLAMLTPMPARHLLVLCIETVASSGRCLCTTTTTADTFRRTVASTLTSRFRVSPLNLQYPLLYLEFTYIQGVGKNVRTYACCSAGGRVGLGLRVGDEGQDATREGRGHQRRWGVGGGSKVRPAQRSWGIQR